MGAAQETHAQRQSLGLAKFGTDERECVDVVAHFRDVGRPIRTATELKRDNVFQRRLGALDLRGKHRFLAHESVQEPIAARDHASRQVQPLDGGHGFPLKRLNVIFHQQGGLARREWVRDEGPYLFSAADGGLIRARGTCHRWLRPLSVRHHYKRKLT